VRKSTVTAIACSVQKQKEGSRGQAEPEEFLVQEPVELEPLGGKNSRASTSLCSQKNAVGSVSALVSNVRHDARRS
jgi:hypothetical protein